MRTVAIAISIMSLVAALPTSAAADECATPGAFSFCVPITVASPNTPPGVPSVPQTEYHGKYYLWLGAGHCVPAALSNDCRSWPGTNPGVPLPNGGQAPGPGLFGVLFEESNNRAGLQRSLTFVAPDRMVLV